MHNALQHELRKSSQLSSARTTRRRSYVKGVQQAARVFGIHVVVVATTVATLSALWGACGGPHTPCGVRLGWHPDDHTREKDFLPFCEHHNTGPFKEIGTSLTSLFLWLPAAAAQVVLGQGQNFHPTSVTTAALLVAMASLMCHASLGEAFCVVDRIVLTAFVWFMMAEQVFTDVYAAVDVTLSVVAIVVGVSHGVLSSMESLDFWSRQKSLDVGHRETLFLVGLSAVALALWQTLASRAWRLTVFVLIFLAANSVFNEANPKVTWLLGMYSLPVVAALLWGFIKPATCERGPRVWCTLLALVSVGGAFYIRENNEESGSCNRGATNWSHSWYHSLVGVAVGLLQARLSFGCAASSYGPRRLYLDHAYEV